MTEHTVAIAPIPLARSTGRLLAVPLLLLLAGVAAVAGGATVGGLAGIGLVAAGIVVGVLGLYLAARLVTVRLDVEVATLRLRWLGGERQYTLVRGPVTRVALQGDAAASLRPRFGALGWAVGRARLRRQEQIDIVRLAPTASLILVPTDRGRFGIAPASEEHLLSALAAAARIQQRLDEVAERARAFAMPMTTAESATQPAAREATSPAPEGRRMLTGIERQLLEERLAAERAAALQRAEAERQAGMHAAMPAPLAVATAQEPAPVPADPGVRERRRGRWQRPAWLAGRAAAEPESATDVPFASAVVTAPAIEAVPPAEPRPVAEPEAPARPAVRSELLLTIGLALIPVIGAGAVWLIAWTRGELALPIAELRMIALALLAVGPAGALAALAARAWYPRLQGLVTITALCALVLVGRALLG
jgi:hypothetical protein